MARECCPDCGGKGVDEFGDDCTTCDGAGEVEDDAFDGDTAPGVTEPP